MSVTSQKKFYEFLGFIRNNVGPKYVELTLALRLVAKSVLSHACVVCTMPVFSFSQSLCLYLHM